MKNKEENVFQKYLAGIFFDKDKGKLNFRACAVLPIRHRLMNQAIMFMLIQKLRKVLKHELGNYDHVNTKVTKSFKTNRFPVLPVRTKFKMKEGITVLMDSMDAAMPYSSHQNHNHN